MPRLHEDFLEGFHCLFEGRDISRLRELLDPDVKVTLIQDFWPDDGPLASADEAIALAERIARNDPGPITDVKVQVVGDQFEWVVIEYRKWSKDGNVHWDMAAAGRIEEDGIAEIHQAFSVAQALQAAWLRE